jgi:hypothetical protein
MNFGYLIFVSKSENYDYLKMAYALAVSIKNTQKHGYDKVALVIDDAESVETQCKSPWVFDHIIKWNQETFWDGRSWMDKLTPFDETICLDADMIFLRDYSQWVDDIRKTFDLFLPSRSYTYRGQVVNSDYYRKAFTRNDLPNLYSFYTFFKKESLLCEDFFKLSRYITKHGKEFSNLFLENFRPSAIGTDEAFSLSAKLLGIENYITSELDFPRIVHMKPEIQNWPWSANKVTDHAGFYFKPNGRLKIGNYDQSDIVHYVEKDLATDEMVSLLEEVLWKK